MAANVCEYIRNCLPCAKWVTLARLVPFTPIQNGEPEELIEIDFISLFEKSDTGISTFTT